MACALALGRRRESRRRVTLNRALHELRRPLQLLALDRGRSAPLSTGADPLDAALAALRDLDAQVNGSSAQGVRRPVGARRLLSSAVERWRSPVALLGRELELELPIGEPVLSADPVALSRALDNLIANSLEHGASRVRVAGRVRGSRLRIAVADGPANGARGSLAGAVSRSVSRAPDPRRGHGLGVVARVAADHGGRFALSRGEAGSVALLELPLARGPHAATG